MYFFMKYLFLFSIFLFSCSTIKKAPVVKIDSECNSVLKNTFHANYSDEKKEKCVISLYDKLKVFNDYTYNKPFFVTPFISPARPYYSHGAKDEIKINHINEEIFLGGSLFRLKHNKYDVMHYEAPYGGDLFMEMAWQYNISTYVTLTTELDNRPEKLQAYRNTSHNRVDLHYLMNIVDKNLSLEYRIVDAKTIFSNDKFNIIQANLQRFGEKRKIVQIQYKKWVDETAFKPEDLFEIVEMINKYHNNKDRLGVNCFAGLHRTKTVSLALYLYNLQKQKIEYNIEDILAEYKNKVYGPFIFKYGEQAPNWKNKNDGQWHLLIKFDEYIKNLK